MDLPEPPRVVFEQPAPCGDAARAEELLRRALAPSVAPHGGWTVTMRVRREGATLHAEGELTDESEAPVAHRVLAKDARECAALAKAVGVWASLVLDQEMTRAAEKDAKPDTTEEKARPIQTSAALWPPPAAPEKPSPEADLFLKNPEDKRTVEIGVGTWIMGGTGAGTVAGPAIFVIVEAGNGWFLRPQVSVGRTIRELESQSDVYATWGATRFDACKRLPGNYLEQRGLQLDLCAGTDLGFLHFDPPSDLPGAEPAGARTLPFFALGPSFGMRGELGSELSVTLRGVAEVNLIRDSFVDRRTTVEPSLFVGRGEVGFSWRLR